MKSIRAAFYSVAFLAFAGGAQAADQIVVQPERADWTGAYIGAFIGAGGIVNNIELPGAGPGNFNGIGGEGFLGGIFIGYNYQATPSIVIGVEGEIGFSNLESELNIPPVFALDASPQWTAALSGRLGWLPTPQTMIYLIGGYTYTDYDVDITLVAAAPLTASFSQNYHGFHIGTGIETHVSDRVTARVEYRYTHFGGQDWGTAGFLNVEPSSHTGRVALAYNFHDSGLGGIAGFGGSADWTGFYAGLTVGAGAIVNNIKLPGAGPGNFDGIGGEGILGGVLVGYDHQFGTSLVVGLQAEANVTNLSTTLNIPPFLALDAQPDWTASFSGRLGWLARPETMLYAIAGYTHADYDVDITLLGAPFNFSQDYGGVHLGAGIETWVADNLTARVEYRYAHFGGESWGTGGFLNVEPSSHTGTASVVWRFGAGN